MTDAPQGPVVIDLGAEPARPDLAAPVPDAATDGAAMQRAVALAAAPGSALGRWFWGALGALVSFALGLAAWDWAVALLARAPVLGAVASALGIVVAILLVLLALRELAAFARLNRLDRLQQAANAAIAAADLAAARQVAEGVARLYRGRPELSPGLVQLATLGPEVLDAEGLLGLVEHQVLAPLDRAAEAEVARAARAVAAATALVPMAFADVAAALAANLRMIRAIATLYGGRGGALGNWRLARRVMAHLVATGAVAVGDDLIGSLAGGGLLAKLSRRFGEGVVNGALTARVGVAAIDLCRPLPFLSRPRPSAGGLVAQALRGLFGG